MGWTARRGGKGRRGGTRRIAVLIALLAASASPAAAQAVTWRGFVDGAAVLYPQEALNDSTQVVGDLLARGEMIVKPAPWVQFAGGLDLRANSHDQVEDGWRFDVDDRDIKRPRVSLRRLTATFTHGPLTIDAGKQFVRWGKADIVNPTDRFAPRDYLNVVDTDLLGVIGARGVVQRGSETFEVVWVPRFTPSRVPLLDQRWTVLPPAAAGVPFVDNGSLFPTGSQTGVRWGHVGDRYEASASFFNGYNNLPNIEAANLQGAVGLTRTYPAIRTYGADAAVPTPWFTIKGEAAWFTSRASAGDLSSQSGAAAAAADEYVLYVVQVERQTGEWMIVAGYSGDVTTRRRAAVGFAPDRGLARSIVARASYTIDPVRSVAVETAIHQNGHGALARVEYSQARGQHWRATISGVGIAGEDDDFIGQYHRNSYVGLALRYSF